MLSRSIFLLLNLNGNALPYYRYTNFSFVTPPFLPQLQPSGFFCALLPCFPAFFAGCCFSCPLAAFSGIVQDHLPWGRRATQRSTVSMWLLRLFMCASFMIRGRGGMRKWAIWSRTSWFQGSCMSLICEKFLWHVWVTTPWKAEHI